MQLEADLKKEHLKLYESVIQWVQTLKTKWTDNYLETDEDLKIDENWEQIQEGTINNLNKYNWADSFHFKIPKIIRSTTERMPKTPKHEAHLQFYKETFESFNDAFTTPHVLKHKTININAERNRNLD